MSLILAIDLGKYNSVFCGLETTTGEAEFRTAKTTPATLRKELTRRPVDRVVIEAYTPAGRVHDLCDELGLRCDMANTTHHAWAWNVQQTACCHSRSYRAS